MSHDIEHHGLAIVPGVLETDACQELLSALGPTSGAGRRGLLALPAVARLARSPRILDLIRPHLPGPPKAVRALYFDKSADTNWLVPWHQDLTLALRTRASVPGFGPWSLKDGIPHAQPPMVFLEQMLTVRLHLDDADDSNGALRVLPGTHCLGRLSPGRIQELRRQQSEFLCAVAPGGALLMRPLLLHASSRSRSTRPRRIVHLEYAAFTLPGGLQWHDAA